MKLTPKIPIIQKDKHGKIIAVYESLGQAAKATGELASSVSAIAKGKFKSRKGLYFEYAYTLQTTCTRCTLCDTCDTPSPVCTWKRNFTPVTGWEAEQTELKISSGIITNSYIVKKCPLYTNERKMQNGRK